MNAGRKKDLVKLAQYEKAMREYIIKKNNANNEAKNNRRTN